MMFKALDTNSVITFIVHSSNEQGHTVTKTRLIKFLYLFDLFWAQETQKTFTNFEWTFLHFGPHATQANEAIEQAVAAGLITSSIEAWDKGADEYDVTFFRCANNNSLNENIYDIRHTIPMYVKANLLSKIKDLGGNTAELLNFVYFNTGPMQEAKPSEILSFLNEKKIDFDEFRPLPMKSLSKAKKQKVIDLIHKLPLHHHSDHKREIYDDKYQELINCNWSEETPHKIQGKALLHFVGKDD